MLTLAGKSNVVDALSFVFGLDLQSVRATAVLDFVHRGKSADASANTKCRVVLRTEEESELSFEREILRDGRTIERVNGEKKKMEDYVKIIKGTGIDPDARNFLIQQMEIQSIVSKSEKDMAEFFERMSGSLALKADYDTALKKKKKAEEAHAQEAEVRQAIQKKKSSLKEQQKEAERYEELHKQEGDLFRRRLLLRALDQERELDSAASELEDCASRIGVKVAEAEALEAEVVALKKAKAKLQKELAKADKLREEAQVNVAKLVRPGVLWCRLADPGRRNNRPRTPRSASRRRSARTPRSRCWATASRR